MAAGGGGRGASRLRLRNRTHRITCSLHRVRERSTKRLRPSRAAPCGAKEANPRRLRPPQKSDLGESGAERPQDWPHAVSQGPSGTSVSGGQPASAASAARASERRFGDASTSGASASESAGVIAGPNRFGGDDPRAAAIERRPPSGTQSASAGGGPRAKAGRGRPKRKTGLPVGSGGGLAPL